MNKPGALIKQCAAAYGLHLEDHGSGNWDLTLHYDSGDEI